MEAVTEETTVATEQVEQPLEGMEETPQTQQEILDWTQDKRANSMWKNDPNQLYASYKNMEKEYAPTREQVNIYNNVFKEYGVESDKIGDVLKEYKSYKDPQAPINQWLDYLGKQLSSEHKDDVIKFFNELDQKSERAKYGENRTPEEIAQLKAGEQALEELNQMKQAQQEQQALEQSKELISSKLSEVEEMASKYDIKYDDEVKQGLLQYCSDNDIDPKYIPAVFSQFALDAVRQSASVKSERAVVKNQQANKAAGITTRTVGVAPKSGAGSMREQLSKAIFGE